MLTQVQLLVQDQFLSTHLNPNTMLFFLLLALAALLPAFTHATPWGPWHPSPPGPPCLSDAEALDIATRYEDVFNANAITSLSQLTSIVSSNIAHLDENFDESTVGIEAFYESLVAPGNYTTTDAVESVLFLIHSCDQIAVRWQENAITTGYES